MVVVVVADLRPSREHPNLEWVIPTRRRVHQRRGAFRQIGTRAVRLDFRRLVAKIQASTLGEDCCCCCCLRRDDGDVVAAAAAAADFVACPCHHTLLDDHYSNVSSLQPWEYESWSRNGCCC